MSVAGAFSGLAGGYQAILADPPWAFRTFSGETMTPHRCGEDHYATMTLGELKQLPVGAIAAKDCALFMWVVGSHLVESIALAEAWGFAFKTDAFYWVKQRLVDADQIDLFTGDIPEPRMGFGYWTRKQVEPCWLFTRGAPRRLAKGVRQTIIEPRREHSRKPDEQYPRIEALVAGPYLELFARSRRPGWDSWGNQTDKFECADGNKEVPLAHSGRVGEQEEGPSSRASAVRLLAPSSDPAPLQSSTLERAQ